jgi:hypothetical protein
MGRRNRGGRKRKQGVERTPSGQISRAGQHPWTDELMEKRAAWVGQERARYPEGGTALGKLCGAGLISERQKKAGEAFAADCMEYARLACSPPRHPIVRDKGMPAPLPTEEQEEAMARKFAVLRARLDRIRQLVATLPGSALVWAAIDSIVIDDTLPPTWERPEMIHPPALAALRRGLDLLAAEYRIPDDEPINGEAAA